MAVIHFKKKPSIPKSKFKNPPAAKPKLTKFRPIVRTRHPSHNVLRDKLELLPFRSIIRLGSTTVKDKDKGKIECNSALGCKTSSSKLLMKEAFAKADIKTASWCYVDGADVVLADLNAVVKKITNSWKDKLVCKHIYGSRGEGNTLVSTEEEFNKWKAGKTINNYIFERFYNYTREYRLHVTTDGCFYACRKMIKSDTPKDKRWFRNDSNSSWIMDTNEMFDKPSNWDEIVNECVEALKAVHLDICGFDVKVQSKLDSKKRVRDKIDFIIIESNSACSFGDVTAQKYLKQIPIVLIKKSKAKYNNE